MKALSGLNMTRKQWYSFWRLARKGGHAGQYIPRDHLFEKQGLIDHIRECAVDGKIAVNVDQMDCDCSRWTSSSIVPATFVAYERHCDSISEDAEGPVYGCWITSPEERAAYSSRDLALEAFEDGHAHSVSMVRYDEDGCYEIS